MARFDEEQGRTGVRTGVRPDIRTFLCYAMKIKLAPLSTEALRVLLSDPIRLDAAVRRVLSRSNTGQ